MGAAGSYPAFDMNRTACLLKGGGLSRVCYSFKDGHPLEYLDVSDNQLTQLPLNLKNLRVIDLSNNKLNELNAQMVQAIESYENLLELKLAHNNLTSLPAIIGKMQNLNKLHLSGNKFTEPPKEIQFIQFLDLSCNKLTYITMTDRLVTLYANFNRLTTLSCLNRSLTTLNISGNDIVTIDDAKFESLQNLDVSSNMLESIDKIMENCPRLEILDISYNKIKHIPALPDRLITLNANDNQISSIDPSFSNLPLLRTIFIFNNNLTSIPRLPKLASRLRIDSNKLTDFPTVESDSIEGIQLMSNMLTDIPNISKTKIQLLYCCDNKISLLSPKNLCNSLISINLSQNSISVLPKELFSLPTLQTLTLNDNFIKEIPPEIEDSKLLQLNISSNPISEMSPLPSTLQCLLAFNCKFTEISTRVRALPFLRVLDMSYNEIKRLVKLDGCANIFFGHNQINEVPELWKDLLLCDLSYNQITKVAISQENTLMQELDLSHNNLKEFVVPGVRDRLKILKLSHNPEFSFRFDFETFPKLDSIDVSCTKVKIPYPPSTLRELLTSDLKFFKSADLNSVNYISPGIGYADLKGYRETMEDSLLVRTDFPAGFDAFAVLDGHGGSATAMEATHLFHQHLSEMKAVTELSIRKMVESLVEDVKKANYEDGCTLCMAIICSGTIFAVNIGDSRMLLVKDKAEFVPLSKDHKPNSRDELERIRKTGNCVANGRTSGILALSRSIGDFGIGGVSSSPDIVVHKIEQGDRKVVICCDGVYDVLSNEEVAKHALRFEDPFESAAFIRNAAFARQTQDNVTSIVIDLARYKQN